MASPFLFENLILCAYKQIHKMSVDYQISQVYTETAGRRPTPSQLDTGQLWVNIADGVIGTKNSDNEIVELAAGGAIALAQAYVVCSTDAATAAKTVAIDRFSLTAGAIVIVKFTNGNTASNPTLNVSGTGAKPLYYCDAALPTSMTPRGCSLMFVYSGNSYDVLCGFNASNYYTKTESDDRFVSNTDGTVSGSLTIT